MPLKSWLTLSDGSILTRQEQFVLQQVAKGEIADLKQEFGEAESDRRLRARFLEELLTGGMAGFKVHRRGIDISQAVVAEALDLENAEIAPIVSLDECHFQEQATFQDASFQKHLFLNDCQFSKKAGFHRVEVKLGLLCRGAIFQNGVDFSHADIGGQFSAGRAQFQGQGPENEATFNGMKVGQSAFFGSAQFDGPVDFSIVKVGEHFDLGPWQKSPKDNPQETIFRSSVNFGTADIGGQFNGNETQFQGQGKDNKANFNGMKVGQNAFFDSAVFQGPVDFVGADIGGQFVAYEAQFQGQGPDHKANFNAMKVGQSAFFGGAQFDGPVDFSIVKVGEHFDLRPWQKSPKDNPQETIFKSSVNFGTADIGGQFNAKEAQFKDEANAARFDGLKVGDIAFFDGALFQGGLSLADARVLDLLLRKMPQAIPSLSMERLVVGRKLALEDATIGELKAANLEVKVSAGLQKVTITGEADLRDAMLRRFKMVAVAWPEPQDGQERVYLDGLTYEGVTTRSDAEQPEDWQRLYDWLGRSQFNTRNYGQLAAYLQEGGHRRQADKAYILGRRRALRLRRWWSPARWGLTVFWDWLTGYGRKPGRVVVVSLGIILLGAFIYDPKQFFAVQKKLGIAPEGWLATIILRLFLSWYVLLSALPGWSALLPLDNPDLGSFAFIWFWFQRFCGWLLVSIGLTAVYTRLK